MPEKSISIQDDSGDKEFFTIVPNYILNHSTALDQALYLQLKRLSGDGKTNYCYPSVKYLMKNLGVGKKALRKSFEYLLKNKWIDFLGKKRVMTAGGHQWINTYKINNIWKVNTDYYKGGSERTPLSKGGLKELKGGLKEPKGGLAVACKEERIKELNKEQGLDKPTGAKRKEVSFKKSEMDRVIKAYEKLKGVQFNGREYLPIQQAIKTMFMSNRSADDIINCMRWFAEKAKSGEKEYIWTKNWTINTIKIKLPEFLSSKLEEEEIEIPSYAKNYVKRN